jgi:hypothetical protein
MTVARRALSSLDIARGRLPYSPFLVTGKRKHWVVT